MIPFARAELNLRVEVQPSAASGSNTRVLKRIVARRKAGRAKPINRAREDDGFREGLTLCTLSQVTGCFSGNKQFVTQAQQIRVRFDRPGRSLHLVRIFKPGAGFAIPTLIGSTLQTSKGRPLGGLLVGLGDVSGPAALKLGKSIGTHLPNTLICASRCKVAPRNASETAWNPSCI
jgi:hypothetical protein